MSVSKTLFALIHLFARQASTSLLMLFYHNPKHTSSVYNSSYDFHFETGVFGNKSYFFAKINCKTSIFLQKMSKHEFFVKIDILDEKKLVFGP